MRNKPHRFVVPNPNQGNSHGANCFAARVTLRMLSPLHRFLEPYLITFCHRLGVHMV